jgi:3',5'-cyclic AMP phosphodiesterase CpdA
VSRFLHLSDIHITQDYRAVPIFRLGWRFWMAWYELALKDRARDYVEAGANVRRILEQARAHGVDHVVLSGDLTASATAPEFDGAREALADWFDVKRLTVIPGNHDCHHPAALREKRFEARFGPLLDSDLPEHVGPAGYPFVRRVGADAAVVALHSSRLPEIPGISYGKLGRDQLDSLERIVKDPRLEGRAVLVAVHHAPLKPDGKIDKLSHRLVDTHELLALLPGPRFAVLHGHIHHRYHHPATERRPHIFGAGSSTQRGREGFWLIDVSNGRVAAAQRGTLGATPRIEPIALGA